MDNRFYLVMECHSEYATPVCIFVNKDKACDFALEKSNENPQFTYYIYYQVGQHIYNSGISYDSGTKDIVLELDVNAEYLLVAEFETSETSFVQISTDFNALYKIANNRINRDFKRATIFRVDKTTHETEFIGEFNS